ncbi:uncharacterized protein LOC105693719 [Athalia rosae]|uniref:uncharacterized protein LOC105693719 n=1 Tax=Athalia rosae TaxID=37344 RepID=UPI002033681A|nr:uncharacterized protein LOC105693719 [Athalia rosae]
MNRREDPLLRQHRSRLMQLVEVTNIRPGRGNGKRRGQRAAQGSSPGNAGNGGSGSRVTLQDIVRSDPGYTSNIEHLVFPERKNSNPNLAPGGGVSPPANKIKGNNKPGNLVTANSLGRTNSSSTSSSGMSRIAEVFARHYARGSSQDSNSALQTSRKNHVNSASLDSGVTGSVRQQIPASSGTSGSGTGRGTNGDRGRWLSAGTKKSQTSHSQQNPSQPARQHSAEDGLSSRGDSSGPHKAPRRQLSPSVDPVEHSATPIAPRSSERGPNVSILHLRGASLDPRDSTNPQITSGSSLTSKQQVAVSCGKSGSTGVSSRSGSSYNRGTNVPGIIGRLDGAGSGSSTFPSSASVAAKSRNQDSQENRSSTVGGNHQRRRDDNFLSGSGGTSGELFASGNCSRELSPVRWCDREVDGVYLGRSGWVQVQQRSLDENRRMGYETAAANAAISTLPLPRRTVKLADYHCSNSEPGNCPDLVFGSPRPDFLALHAAAQDLEPPPVRTSPHSIPESFSPPSITPIISPPPAFQDTASRKTNNRNVRGRHGFGKPPFLPRSNAIVDSDVISPPPSQSPSPSISPCLSPSANVVNWGSLVSSPTRGNPGGRVARRQTPSPGSTTPGQQQQQQPYRLAQAKSLEDQTGSCRRSQFVQRYKESSSSSSSSLGFRSLDSCVSRGAAMPRLAENTDSSVEGYEDGDEDDNPSSSANPLPAGLANLSPDPGRSNGSERISPSSGRPGRGGQYHCSRGQIPCRRSPGSAGEGGKQMAFNSPSSSSSSSGSNDRQGRSPTPNPGYRKNNNTANTANNNNNNNNGGQSRQRMNQPSSPESLQTRVRRSRSLQLPERRSPGNGAPQLHARGHFRDNANDQHRLVVKVPANSERNSTERSKRHVLPNRKAQSTDSALNDELLREAEVVTEFLYGTRSRAAARNLLTSRQYERRDEQVGQEQRRSGTGSGSYEVYFVPPNSQQQQRQQPKQGHQGNNKPNQRPRTLQRGSATPNASDLSPGEQQEITGTRASPESQSRCNGSTCSFWPYCSQRDSQLYSPGQSAGAPASGTFSGSSGNMRASQSYPAHNRLTLQDTGQLHGTSVGKNSASSSPASLEQVDDRESLSKNREKRNRPRDQAEVTSSSSSSWNKVVDSRERDRGERSTQKSLSLKSVSRRSPGSNGGTLESNRKSANGNFEGSSLGPNKLSPCSGGVATPSTSSSSSSSDIWVTTSDRTVTKSPRNAKSSGASTPMEDAMIGPFAGLPDTGRDAILSRPGSAPAQREETGNEDSPLDPQQRSLSLPKSFLARNDLESRSSSNAGSTPWHRGFNDYQRSTTSPNNCPIQQDIQPPHTAPVSPLHEHLGGLHGLKDRRRAPTLNKAQRRAKASSTPALLDRDQDGRQWSADEEERVVGLPIATEHPTVEASIPLVGSHHQQLRVQHHDHDSGIISLGVTGNIGSQVQLHQVVSVHGGGVTGAVVNRHQQQQQSSAAAVQNNQESVLQKFRKSFSLRFNKKGSKESSEGGDGPGNDESNILNIDDDDEREPPPPPAPQQLITQNSMQNKEDQTSDQKFRFGPLVWRTSKERKKNSKAARNAKCNSGDSGIQIEMVSGGALTGGIGGSGGGAQGAGDSSESHDTDAPDDMDSPPALRRRVTDKSRPQSELINQILIDKFKADLQSRTSRHHHVRRTNSDLGGQRLLQWDTRSGYSQTHNYRRMLSTPSPIKTRPPRLSPRHSSNDIVTLRNNSKGRNVRTNLRRSLSQPLGINQLSPLMRTRTAGARVPGGNVLSEDEHDPRCGGGTSEDEMMSDSETSVASLSDRKKSMEQTMEEDIAILAEAVWDHVAIDPEELAFRAGDVIDVLDTFDRDWWWGSCKNEHGWFPAAFVRLRVSQEDTVEDCLAAMASGVSTNSQLRRRTSVSLLSNEQVRSSVVGELVQTERDFVKVLRDISKGYIAECRRRTDMFTEDQIDAIFINLEELLDFQSDFLNDLESVIDWNALHKSCLGECFLKRKAGFRMYSEYCNSHPMAMATLQELYQHNRYSKFFEGCRLMRGLIEIPLDGYLLTPVQRICKYPLQLAELLKYTKAEHPDFEKIKEALEAMRGVAVLINERKRRMESLEKLAAWQQRVEGWEAEDLIEVSSQLIHQGEVIRVTTGMWTNTITLFLFDHQIVYCKKDILKRNTYVYKGRIYLDTSEVIDVPDGKDPQLGVTVRNCLKVYSCVRDKWLLFCCRTADEKRQWLAAMAEERRLVKQDRNDGLEFPPAARQLAKIAATRERCRPPSKPSNKTYKRNSAYEVPMLAGQQGAATNSLGRKVGTWFTFGSSKKGTRHHNQPS